MAPPVGLGPKVLKPLVAGVVGTDSFFLAETETAEAEGPVPQGDSALAR